MAKAILYPLYLSEPEAAGRAWLIYAQSFAVLLYTVLPIV